MGRREINTGDIKIDQKPIIANDPDERESEIIHVDKDMLTKDYADELAFNEELVKIRLEPSAERNAPTSHPFWVNGKGCEVMVNGRFVEMIYIPVGRPVTTKRKYLAVMASAKYDTVNTDVDEMGTSEVINNRIRRATSGVVGLSVLEDKNPRGAAWLSEIRRRNF